MARQSTWGFDNKEKEEKEWQQEKHLMECCMREIRTYGLMRGRVHHVAQKLRVRGRFAGGNLNVGVRQCRSMELYSTNHMKSLITKDDLKIPLMVVGSIIAIKVLDAMLFIKQ